MKLLSFETFLYFKPCILYDLNRQSSKSRNLQKKQLILSHMKNLRKFQNCSLWSHSKTKYQDPYITWPHLTREMSEKVGAHKPGLDYSTFWNVVLQLVLPKKFQKL